MSSLTVTYQLDSTVLTSDRLNRTASNVTQSPLTFTPLQIHEGFLSRGDIVAIDAEFVTLNQVSQPRVFLAKQILPFSLSMFITYDIKQGYFSKVENKTLWLITKL